MTLNIKNFLVQEQRAGPSLLLQLFLTQLLHSGAPPTVHSSRVSGHSSERATLPRPTSSLTS